MTHKMNGKELNEQVTGLRGWNGKSEPENYAGDLNKAISLVDEMRNECFDVEIRASENGYTVEIFDTQMDSPADCYLDSSLAVAICCAYIDWRNSNDY